MYCVCLYVCKIDFQWFVVSLRLQEESVIVGSRINRIIVGWSKVINLKNIEGGNQRGR